MKELISTFIFALILSCLLNSIYTGPPPFPWTAGVSDVKETTLGGKREEAGISEMQYVDGARPYTIMTTIDAAGQQRNVDMPLGANN